MIVVGRAPPGLAVHERLKGQSLIIALAIRGNGNDNVGGTPFFRLLNNVPDKPEYQGRGAVPFQMGDLGGATPQVSQRGKFTREVRIQREWWRSPGADRNTPRWD